MTRDDGRQLARFRITNTGPDSLWYTWHDGVPLHTTELQLGGVWEPNNDHVCRRTRRQLAELKPSEEMIFAVTLSDGATAVKTGLYVSTRKQEVSFEEDDVDSAGAAPWADIWNKRETGSRFGANR